MDRDTLSKHLRLAYKKGFAVDGSFDLDMIGREVVKEVQSRLPGPEKSSEQVFLPHRETAVAKSDRYAPIFNRTFLEYSEFRGFIIDPARPNDPTGKPKVERQAPYVRKNFFAGESFRGLSHIQEEAIRWCRDVAGMRIHGTTKKRSLIIFNEEESSSLHPFTEERFDVPRWGSVKVHPDHHIRFGNSLYSAPTQY